MKHGPQVYDLPVANLTQNDGEYIPPKARDESEAERRRANPKGSLVLEAQHDGAHILRRTLEGIEDDPEAHEYFVREMGSVCLNTAWYSYANLPSGANLPANDQIGRRRLELPKHAFVDDAQQVHFETSRDNAERLRDGLAYAANLAQKLETTHKARLDRPAYRYRKQFGRTIGNLGLRLAATPLIGRRDTPHAVQVAVRDAGRDAIEHSRQVYDGVYPTIAQLPDLDSQLSVYLRRTAPTVVYGTLIDATARVQHERMTRNEL